MTTDNNKTTKKHKAQVRAAMVVLIVGCVMVLSGLVIPPIGEIHPSVLVAFGECLTFAGAVLGAKYYADFKSYIHELTKNGKEVGHED